MVNKTILVGRVGNINVVETWGGMKIATLSLATDRQQKGSNGEAEKVTDWHNVKLFGKTAEVAEKYVQKGKQLYIEGFNTVDEYEKDGATKKFHYVSGYSMQMLGGGDGGQKPPGGAPPWQS